MAVEDEEFLVDETEEDLIEESDLVPQEEAIEEADADDAPGDDESDAEITDEQLDEIADVSIEVLQNILKHFNVGEVTIDEYEGDEGELILDITGDDLAVLIGRHGNTLDALQLLFSSIIIRKLGFKYPVVIDVEGYKSRLRQKIESIARSAATRAVNQRKNIKLHPMNPYERRIVHVTLKDNPKVDTISEGEGGNRHVIIIPL